MKQTMEPALLLSMAAFALAASISPGPVNLVGFNSGVRNELRSGLWFVSGATLGFIALFVAVGLGLHGLLSAVPAFAVALKYAGMAFLIYLSLMLIRHDGQLTPPGHGTRTGFLTGVAMQWLNPKAWLASASGIGAYAGGGELSLTLAFAALYLPICWLSLSSWVFAGRALGRWVATPRRLRWMNRSIALLLLLSALYLLVTD